MGRFSWILWVKPKCHDSVLVREGDLMAHDGGKGGVTSEAEIRVIQPQAREQQQPPEAGRGREGSPTPSLQRAPQYLDLSLLASRAMRAHSKPPRLQPGVSRSPSNTLTSAFWPQRVHFCSPKPPGCCNLLLQPQEMHTGPKLRQLRPCLLSSK